MTMDAISYSAFRANLAKKMNEICENHLGVIVTRKGGKSVVVISLEDYRGMEETAYLLSNPNNAKRLLKAIDDVEKGNVFEKELIEE